MHKASPPLHSSRHPRRPLAQDSVSLPKTIHHARSHLRHPSARHRSSARLSYTHESSGETSNAEQWFDKSNQEVLQHRGPFRDNDSPFFLPNKDDSEDSPPYHGNNLHLPVRAAALPVHSSHGSSSGFRSVIDDLTVENQNLKRYILKQDMMRDAHLDGEKLVSVKVHGLSSDKKRELEELVRNFVAGINSPTPSEEIPLNSSGQMPVAIPTPLIPMPKKTESSPWSAAKWPADSGYGSAASNTAWQNRRTAGGSTSQSTLASSSGQAVSAKANDSHVRTYLKDIPCLDASLRDPDPRIPMTDRSRKKLVVRRLEQLFRGRGAAVGGHQQSQQQQEVSHSATREANKALAAHGMTLPLEGVREAKIMESDDATIENLPSASRGPGSSNPEESSEVLPSKSPSPQQRPTRPLDLDPGRAQVPAENISYIHHLGFLRRHEDEQETAQPDGGDWIYVNLLIGMAQLHTLNVTPDFVKAAIAEFSTKFDLSNDGRKARWKGSTDGGDTPMSPVDEDSTRKRSHPLDPEASMGNSPKRQALDSDYQSDKWRYRPLFSHPQSGTASLTHLGQGSSSAMPGALSGCTGHSYTGRQAMPPNNRGSGDGIVIFYKRGTFCTDLSGDAGLVMRTQIPMHLTPSPSALHPLGEPLDLDSIPDPTKLKNWRFLSRPPSAEVLEACESLDVDFPQFSPKSVSFVEPEEPFPLSASGIGGVAPADNFAITVVRQRTSSRRTSTSHRSHSTTLSKLSSAFEGRSKRSMRSIDERIVSTRITKLEPAPLPPAILNFLESSDYASDSESESDSGSAVEDSEGHSYPAALAPGNPESNVQHIRVQDESSGDADEEEMEDEDDEAESISSTAAQPLSVAPSSPRQLRAVSKIAASETGTLDFLSLAREMHPERIRTEERRYDADLAEKLAEEIPAGSSAATAGGGSGYGSPEDESGGDGRVRDNVNAEAEGDEEDEDDDDDMSNTSAVSNVPS